MKALFIVTGRGIGGDAGTALNIAHSLSKYGVESEFALDHSAPGLLLKKHQLKWYRTSIPQAGGHAATKLSLLKAAFRTFKASLEASRLCRKVRPDVVVGVIGGGAIIGCLGAKIAGIPSVGILITPTDAKVCTKLTTSIVLPESRLFTQELEDNRIFKAYSPINSQIVEGDRNKALEKMPTGFNAEKLTILFSSGSSLFKKMAMAAERLGESEIDVNIFVVGESLEDSYKEHFEQKNVFYLGYVDWIQDLYKLVDLAILTDDGLMIHEAMALKIPVIVLLGVKYGRYHNLAEIFKGAVLESDLENIQTVTQSAINNMEIMKKNALNYSKDVLKSSDEIAAIIYSQMNKKSKSE
jgi:UDP-N-acetylglucosamine--N-acetylmuramyl-(pentapeptide) pyrophosphoryl-undecaprenol N-acetylglucosamine transferase